MLKKGCWIIILLVTALTAGTLLAGCPACSNKLEVDNSTIFPITAVYVRMQGSEDWGNNKISDAIWPTETDTITHLFPGCYDVRLSYAGFDEDHEVCIVCQETYTLNAGK